MILNLWVQHLPQEHGGTLFHFPTLQPNEDSNAFISMQKAISFNAGTDNKSKKKKTSQEEGEDEAVLLTGTTQGTKGRITCLKRKSARVQKAQQEDTGESIILAKVISFIRKISILYPEETQPCP